MLEGLLYVPASNLILRRHGVATSSVEPAIYPLATVWGVYFLIFHGPWVVFLGRSLWWAVRAVAAGLSSGMVFTLAATVGALVGLSYAAAAFSLAVLRDPSRYPPKSSVLVCSGLPRLVAGAFAGLLVARVRGEKGPRLFRRAP